MDAALSVLIGLIYVANVYSVPPDVCFEKFKWQDCGMTPKAVVYYYASGSRCEVGMWRGCLPNSNMFVDEYECVQTCIFSMRARPEEYHIINAENEIESQETTPELPMITTDASDVGNSTSMDGDATGSGENETGQTNTGDGEETAATDAAGDGGDGGDAGDGGDDATTAGEADDAGGETTAAPEEAAAGDPSEGS